MDSRFNAIFERFRDFKEKIAWNIEIDNDFESLCDDYEQCIQLLETLKKEKEQNTCQLAEYLQIKTELEQEVMKYILK